MFFCAPDGVGTSGLLISSPMFYQLSHPVTPVDLFHCFLFLFCFSCSVCVCMYVCVIVCMRVYMHYTGMCTYGPAFSSFFVSLFYVLPFFLSVLICIVFLPCCLSAFSVFLLFPFFLPASSFSFCLSSFLSFFNCFYHLRMSLWWSLCDLYSSLSRWSCRRRLGSLLLCTCSMCDINSSAITSHCLLVCHSRFWLSVCRGLY